MITTHNIDLPEFEELGLRIKIQQIYDAAGIPKKYQFCTLDTAWSTEFSSKQKLTGLAKKRSEAVAKFVRSYIEGLDSILSGGYLKVQFKDNMCMVSDMILDGKKASGKTLLASLIAQEAILRGKQALFVNWVEYLDKFQTFESREENEDYFNTCLKVDLLVLDSVLDYGANNNKFFAIQLDRLITSRQNEGKVTICTVDSSQMVPTFGFAWNRFSRETYKLMLPDPELTLTNETKPKKPRT